MRWMALVGALLATGCLGEGAVVAPSPETEMHALWRYVCEDRPEVAPGVCASSAVDPLAWLGEPAIGAQANGSRVFVAAMAASPTGAAGTGHPIHVVGSLSEDGGATWENVGAIPAPPGGIDHIDASVVVTAEGVIHYSGLAEAVMGASMVFHTMSTDGGRVWSEPVVLSGETDNVVDRNWITQGASGALYVSWQEFPLTSQVAVSHDAGATWGLVVGLPDCDQVSPVLERGASAYVSCLSDATQVARFDITALAAQSAVHVAPGCGRSWLADMGPRMLLVCETMRIHASDDDGGSWSALPEVASVESASEWRGQEVSWAAGSAAGGAHVLLREPMPIAAFGAEGLLPIVDAKVAHLVLDAAGRLQQEMLLTRDAASQRRTDAGAGLWAKDDFHNIAVTPQGVFLAWSRGGGIDVALATTA